MKLDEAALRRPDFRAGVAVTLGDGREWTLRHPLFRRTPEVDASGRLAFGAGRLALTPRYDELMDELFEPGESGGLRLDSALGIAVELLLGNYGLAPEALATLLPWEPDNEANMEMWTTIIGVASGRLVPKP
jgi:hypothetical protein